MFSRRLDSGKLRVAFKKASQILGILKVRCSSNGRHRWECISVFRSSVKNVSSHSRKGSSFRSRPIFLFCDRSSPEKTSQKQKSTKVLKLDPTSGFTTSCASHLTRSFAFAKYKTEPDILSPRKEVNNERLDSTKPIPTESLSKCL